MIRTKGQQAMRRERAEYPKYITTLVTVNRGTLVGKPGQFPSELVMEHYGERAGYRPWERPGFKGMIVDPATSDIEFDVSESGEQQARLVTSQTVRDWVVSVSQELRDL